jgi:nucleotide-binding universal stress UspA family protein
VVLVKVVLVAVTDSTSARQALRWAGDRASSLGAELHVVTAISMPMPIGSPSVSAVCHPDKEQLVAAGLALQGQVIEEELDRACRPRITRTVRIGEAFRVLRDESSHADLVVLGSPRRRWRRSLTSRCLRQLGCPVVVVVEDRPC